MGSTAPVDKLKKKKKTVITLKKLLSEVAEPGVKMGNLCSLGAAAKKVMGSRTLCYIMSCLGLHYFSISIRQSIDFIEPFALQHCTMATFLSIIPLYFLFPCMIYGGIKNSTVSNTGE